MKYFEDELDNIRIELYEKTKEMDKTKIISSVNSHAQKIAEEFGIIIKSEITEEKYQTVDV